MFNAVTTACGDRAGRDPSSNGAASTGVTSSESWLTGTRLTDFLYVDIAFVVYVA